MYLQNLSLVNFKNYEQVELEFSPKINCFVGNNGIGKTNLLDAIYYMSFCKSNFNAIDSQNVKQGESFFVIQGEYQKDDNLEKVYCGIKKGQKKTFKRNKKEYSKLSDHIGHFPLVMISPSDIGLILDGSEERRKFIDGVISQFDKQYLEDLIKYKRVLAQRNKLLKDFAKSHSFDHTTLEIWDDQLIYIGTNIYKKRVKFIEELIPIFQKYYNCISNSAEQVELFYQSQLHEESFENLLKASLQRDRITQYTTVGIHKDDLQLNLKEFPIKKIGSQGQKKTYLVALKLAQFDFITQLNGFKPILLLDDIFDKLDAIRVKQIINLVAENNFGQIFITDTHPERLETILADTDIDYKINRIKEGVIE